jgi:glutamate-1-semialdehyde 2,1-aminomutase
MEHFSSAGGDVLLAGTFNGNPISSAAGIATINYLREHPDFYERTYALGDRIRAGLGAIAGELGIAAVPAGFGGVFALYFTEGPVRGYRDLLRDNDEAYVAFHRRMTDKGLLTVCLRGRLSEC